MPLLNAEQAQYFLANHKGKYAREMAKEMNEKFGLCLKENQVKAYRKNHHLNCGLTGRFEKGNIPANKGVKGISYPGCKATQFKKGNIPANRLPIGTVREKSDGYVYIKIQDGKGNKNWKQRAAINYEKVYGSIPKGMRILRLDGNSKNDEIENLYLVSIGEMAIINHHIKLTIDPDLNKAIVNNTRISMLIKKIKERRKRNEK